MEIRTVFVDDHGQLRSGWRLVAFLAAYFLAVVILLILAGSVLAATSVNAAANGPFFIVVNSLCTLFPAILIGWLCGKYFESLPFRALGCAFTNGWFRNLIWGTIFGAVAIGIAVAVATAFGNLTFKFDDTFGNSQIVSSLFISLVVFAVAAAFEEALFRGYILQTLNRSGLGWLAISLTAIFFGIVHLENRGANVLSTVNTSLAGVWFGLAYLKTRDLWFPFGVHLMWNWLQGSVFGIEVSGRADVSPAPLFNEIDRGPAWLTGENYGIEASIACTIAIICSCLIIYYWPNLKPSEEMLALTSPRSSPELMPSES